MTNLIVITGAPASGKSTLAAKLAQDLPLPLISKDLIKESLYDSLGTGDVAWSRKIGTAAYNQLHANVTELLRCDVSCIVESNFKHEFDTQTFKDWQAAYNCQVVQVFCHAESEVLYNRFKQRIADGNRHPGHHDDVSPDSLKSELYKLAIEPTITLDTNDFSGVDYTEVINRIRLYL